MSAKEVHDYSLIVVIISNPLKILKLLHVVNGLANTTHNLV